MAREDLACQIVALGAIETVEPIHHQEAQGAAAIGQASVVGSEALHLGLEEQDIELLVVGEQDVGRGLVQGALVGDRLAAVGSSSEAPR